MKWLLLLVFVAGCNRSALAVGQSCGVGDSCPMGTSCVDPNDYFVASNDAGCIAGAGSFGRACVRPCDAGADCASLGSDLVCARIGCGPIGLCLRQSDAGAGTR